jgi:SAM-dependent methyltransferase
MRQTKFTEEQFARPYPDGIEHHYWTQARNELIRRTLADQVRERTSLVLDVGCGRGITVAYLRHRGFNAIGSDTGSPKPISSEVIEYLYLNQEALALPIDLRQQVGTILLLDVLEHLPSPVAFVDSLSSGFEACCDILITVPARQELWSNYDEYYGHYRRYDLRSVTGLFPPARFEMTSVRYLFRLPYAFALALAILRVGRSVTIAAPSAAARPVHWMLAKYFELEAAMLPGWLVGTSMMITLRRREHAP